MKIWFLRVAVDDMPISASQLRTRRVVPVLFRDIPLSECSLDLSEDNVRALVDRHYTGSSAGTRGQVAGSLLRFFHQVQVGDVLAVCLNRNPNLLFGEVMDGSLSEFPGIKESKSRPVRWLTEKEIAKLNIDSLPPRTLKYRGTICLWADFDLLDQDEQKKVTFYTKPHDDLRRRQ